MARRTYRARREMPDVLTMHEPTHHTIQPTNDIALYTRPMVFHNKKVRADHNRRFHTAISPRCRFVRSELRNSHTDRSGLKRAF